MFFWSCEFPYFCNSQSGIKIVKKKIILTTLMVLFCFSVVHADLEEIACGTPNAIVKQFIALNADSGTPVGVRTTSGVAEANAWQGYTAIMLDDGWGSYYCF